MPSSAGIAAAHGLAASLAETAPQQQELFANALFSRSFPSIWRGSAHTSRKGCQFTDYYFVWLRVTSAISCDS